MRCDLSEKQMLELRIDAARLEAYRPIEYMNRADRRTAAGRVKVVEAENRFLKAKLKILEESNESA